MKKLLVIIAFVEYAGNAIAQINESDTIKFQLRSSVTGNYQKGNVELLNLKSKIDFSYSPAKDFVFKSQNNSLYQEFYSIEADNDIFSRNYFYYKPTAAIYPFAIAYISTNYRRKVDTRYFAGAGFTWQLLNKQLHTIKVSASAVYESTKFNGTTYNFSEYNGSANINLWRGTFYIGGWHYLLEKHLRLYYDAFWQPAFDNNKNYRNQVDIGLDFTIWKGLSFNTTYAYYHENVTIQNIKDDDKILTFGLAYYFKTKK